MPLPSHPTEKLVVFTRYPQAGRTKTRLIPALGAAGAAELQRRMAEHAFRQCRALAATRNVVLEVRYDGGREQEARQWIPACLPCGPQIEGTLGERLAHCISAGFAEGMQRVVVIGSDCPALTPAILTRGFELLQEHDLVLGPARDGGCYLIGFSKPICFGWHEIAWGTERVLRQFLESAAELGLHWTLLPLLADIDRPEDLQTLAELTNDFHIPASDE
ncbi:MAG: TIGR04282 family arsenosugar biosynthesis glycosyltransferase [Deltaproteobacteria bacterium]|nr:TIGR04282 family arsenosugar biosynthesis glycosyltransferase [Deltaproteobacteria bacterium]